MYSQIKNLKDKKKKTFSNTVSISQKKDNLSQNCGYLDNMPVENKTIQSQAVVGNFSSQHQYTQIDPACVKQNKFSQINDNSRLKEKKRGLLDGRKIGTYPAWRIITASFGSESFALQKKDILQAVWETDTARDEIQKSRYDTVAKIIVTNLNWQEKAIGNEEVMRKSMGFSAVGYEFEFAQLAREERGSEFGRKSHLELARGKYRFPLFPNIPFMVETDMSAVIELAMPPLLIPRDAKTGKIDEKWVATVLLKIETGLKALARNSTANLDSLLGAVGIYLGLGDNYFNIQEPEGEDPKITKAKKAAKYGHMEKNSRVFGKYTTAQANMVTTLAQAIQMSYDQDDLPEEISVMQTLIKSRMNGFADLDNYATFIAQKMTEIPYMFLDEIHAISLREYEDNSNGKEVSAFISELSGHDSNKKTENKVHKRRIDEDPKKHTVRSVVSKVKNRGAGWIKSTLGKQVPVIPLAIRQAASQVGDKEIKNALASTVAHKVILKYGDFDPTGNWARAYENFEAIALTTIRRILNANNDDLLDDQTRADQVREQRDDYSRANITTARPDTVLNLTQDSVVYDMKESNAVLVESRNPTKTFNLPYSSRTTNKRASDIVALKRMAMQQFDLMKDPNWLYAYIRANPDNQFLIEKERNILYQLIHANSERTYFTIWHEILALPMRETTFWNRIIDGMRTLGFLAPYRKGGQRKIAEDNKEKSIRHKHFMKSTFSSRQKSLQIE